MATVNYDFSLTGFKNQKMAKPNHFCWADIWTFWYFDVSMGSDEKSWVFQGFAKIVLWLRTARTDNPDPPKHIWATPISINTTQIPSDIPNIPPSHPQDISREHKASADTHRHRQTPTDIFKEQLAVSWAVRGCLFVSVGFCWRLVFSGDVLGCLGGVWGDVWWYLSGIYGNQRRSNVFGGHLGFHPLQYKAISDNLKKSNWKLPLKGLWGLQRTNSKNPKGLQLEVRPQRGL